MTDATRRNALRRRFDDGRVALSVLDDTYSPSLVELYAGLGLDAVWIDLEHGGPNPLAAADVEGLLRAVEGTATELLVRPPDTDPGLVRKALDAGVRNALPLASTRRTRCATPSGRAGPRRRGTARRGEDRDGGSGRGPRRDPRAAGAGLRLRRRARVDRRRLLDEYDGDRTPPQ